MRHITFYTRANCHLCDSARYVLERVIVSRADVQVTYVDIDTDPALRARYNDHVPVIHLDNEELARHRLDAATLINKLDHAPD